MSMREYTSVILGFEVQVSQTDEDFWNLVESYENALNVWPLVDHDGERRLFVGKRISRVSAYDSFAENKRFQATDVVEMSLTLSTSETLMERAGFKAISEFGYHIVTEIL